VNRPETPEGWEVWAVIMDIGGQLRLAAFGVAGLDMGAALALGRARGVPEGLLADLLPEIEPIVVNAANARIGEAGDG